jgi:hypothetical protein
MTERESTSARKRRPPTEIKVTPESEKWLKERAASPEGQMLLDELARCFVQAAVTRLLMERALAEDVQTSENYLSVIPKPGGDAASSVSLRSPDGIEQIGR